MLTFRTSCQDTFMHDMHEKMQICTATKHHMTAQTCTHTYRYLYLHILVHTYMC